MTPLQEFGIQILATFIGVLLAFFLESRVQSTARTTAKEQESERRMQVIEALTANVGFNMERLERMNLYASPDATQRTISHGMNVENWKAHRESIAGLGMPVQDMADFSAFFHGIQWLQRLCSEIGQSGGYSDPTIASELRQVKIFAYDVGLDIIHRHGVEGLRTRFPQRHV